jgi:ABC-type proline/glycine betaine transport system permease subunit
MCYLIPVICLLKLGKGSKCGKVCAVVFFGTLILIGYTSVGITIYEVVNGLDKMPRINQ